MLCVARVWRECLEVSRLILIKKNTFSISKSSNNVIQTLFFTIYCREKNIKCKWKEQEHKDRIHSFQMLVCSKTEIQLLISNSRTTSLDRCRFLSKSESVTVRTKCDACFQWFSCPHRKRKCHMTHHNHS